MAHTIQEFLSLGDFTIGSVDSKTRIAPVTREGRPIFITLAKTPTLTTPFNCWPSFDGGERTSLDLRCEDDSELAKLAAHIDKIIMKQVLADPTKFYTKPPKNLQDQYNSLHRPPSKEGLSGTFRTKCSFRAKSASFRAWDLAQGTQLTVGQLKELDWPASEMAIVAKLSGVYFQASGFGAVMNLQTVGLRAGSTECPFELAPTFE